jgi:calcineurin-like phosphoesterase family protein
LTKTWLASDTHFSHVNICKFTNADGSPLRPWDDPDEMDEALVKNWNSVVQPQDRVYHLGDVVINRRALTILSRLNGRLKLVKGNHDIFKLSDYLPYFDDICAYVVKKTPQGGKCILSHIPVHPESLGRFGLNIHGHLHSNIVMREVRKNWAPVPDLRYVNVSVEQTNYTPILLEDAIARGVPEDITDHK